MKTCPVCGDVINDDDTTLNPLEQITAERRRQDEKWGANRDLPDRTWLTILIEEVGECARASLEHADSAALRAEIVQVAAVAVAWLECIRDNRHKTGSHR